MCSRQSSSSLLLLMFIATADALSVKTDGHDTTAGCKLPVKECPTAVKGLEIESVMIPGCYDNYTAIRQRLCLEALCNKTSGTMFDFTDVCGALITCPLEARRNYQITEKLHVSNDAPTIQGLFKLIFVGNNIMVTSMQITSFIGCLQMDLRIVS